MFGSTVSPFDDGGLSVCPLLGEQQYLTMFGGTVSPFDDGGLSVCPPLSEQQYLTMFGSTVSIPLIVTPAMCMEESDPARGYVIGTILFVSGIVTLLQVTFGIR